MNILHLSDLHVNELFQWGKNGSQCLEVAINNALENNSPNKYPDILLITGDLTNTGSSSEYKKVLDLMKNMKKQEYFKEVKYTVIVPGNHDYPWTENGRMLSDSSDRSFSFSQFKNNMYELWHSSKDFKDMSNIKSDFLADYIYIDNMGLDSMLNILLVGLNTMIIDSQDHAGIGYFSIEQLNAFKKLQREYNNKSIAQGKQLVTLVAFHHHIVPISPIERNYIVNGKKCSVTLDARRALDTFLECNVSFVFHGHQHQPSIVKWKDGLRYKDNQLNIISAGSVGAKRDDLNEISKNSFMLYSINDSMFKLFHFKTSDRDNDIFEIDDTCDYEVPLLHSIKSNSENKTFCPITKKNPLMEKIFEPIVLKEDSSNLFYLFLDVVDCALAREAIDKFISKYNNDNNNCIIVCGLHDLYGKFDVLLKYRTETNNHNFIRLLRKKLISIGRIIEHARYATIDVIEERIGYINDGNNNLLIPRHRDSNDYFNSTWNYATLEVLINRKSTLSIDMFFTDLKKKIDEFNFNNNTKIEDIIRCVSIGDSSVLFELFISCYQFPMLSRLTNLIEDVIKKDGIDKTTHIVYYFDERGI